MKPGQLLHGLAMTAVALAEEVPVLITHGILDRPGEWPCTCQGVAPECREGCPGRHPRTANGAKDATRDPARLVDWCERYPDSNLAQTVGPGADHLVIETDAPEGKQALEELWQQLGPFPPTRRSCSGRGERWHFRYAEGLTSRVLANKLELRASANQYIVVHGRHYSGAEYRIGSEPLAELPLAWVEFLRAGTATNGHGPAEGATLREGERNSYLTSLLGAARRRGATEEEMAALALAVNQGRCSPPLPEAELLRIAASVARYEPADEPTAPVVTPAPPRSLRVRGLDITQLRPTRFLWERRLVIGVLNLLGGEEGIGKGALTAWLVMRVTRGELPGAYHGTPGKVLWIGDEDAWEEEVGPRLYAAGAELSFVHDLIVSDGQDLLDITRDAGSLDALLARENYALVVFEALLDNLPRLRNPNEPGEVRAALRPLRRVLRDRAVTGLGTMHTGKVQTTEWRAKLAGSHQYNALSRSSLLVGVHPEDKDRRVLLRAKGNYSRRPAPLAFELHEKRFELNDHEFAVVAATDFEEVEVSVEDVLRGAPAETMRAGLREDVLAALTSDPQGVRPLAERVGCSATHARRILGDLAADSLAEQTGRG